MSEQYLREFGEHLRLLRESKRISLRFVASVTRLSLGKLQMIERGEFSFLPRVYIQSYLRQYATALGISEGGLARQYNSLIEKIAFVEKESYTDSGLSDIERSMDHGQETNGARTNDFASELQLALPGLDERIKRKIDSEKKIEQIVLGASYAMVALAILLVVLPSDPFPYYQFHPTPESGEAEQPIMLEGGWEVSAPLFVKNEPEVSAPSVRSDPRPRGAARGG